MPFINEPDLLRDLTIFMISFISSLKIVDVVVGVRGTIRSTHFVMNSCICC